MGRGNAILHSSCGDWLVLKKNQDPFQPFAPNLPLGNKAAFVTTEQTILACRQNNRTAQRLLYEDMAPKLYHTCRRYLQHQHQVEDVLAETFVSIFSHLYQLKEVGAFEAWARRICVHQCLAYLRKQTSFSVHLTDAHEDALPDTSQALPLAAADLMRLLQLLPDGCRTVFNLYAIEGYAHKEIAEMLGISEGTSKSQLNAGRKKLQALVQQFYYPSTNSHEQSR